VIGGFYIGERCFILHALGNKKRTWRNLIWWIFVIRQTAKINSMPNFHLIRYFIYTTESTVFVFYTHYVGESSLEKSTLVLEK